MNDFKVNLIDTLDMLSSTTRQDEYYENVPIANVPAELISAWFDDGFYKDDDEFKSLFSISEWDLLTDFDRFYESKLKDLPEDYSELCSSKAWREVVEKASYLKDQLGW